MKIQKKSTIAGMALLAAAFPLHAGTFTANFNDGQVPVGAAVYGTGEGANPIGGVVESTGGVDNTGCFKLTRAVTGQAGSMVIADLDGGADVNSVTATWMMRMGGGTGTPADGFSFCVAGNLPAGPWSEEGTGNGLTVTFDIYNNNAPEVAAEAPAVDIKWNGTTLRHLLVPIALLRTNDAFVPVVIKLDSDGTLDVTYNGNVLYSDYNIPGFTPITGAMYGWGGRTGGATENQWFDNIVINTTTGAKQPAILNQPLSTGVVAGSPAFFNIRVNDPTNATVQWESKAPAAANFTAIAGATGTELLTAAVVAANAGTQYRAVVTLNDVSIISDAVTLTLADLAIPAGPQISYNFNDGNAPAGTTLLSTVPNDPDGVPVVPAPGDEPGSVQATGGVDGGGFLQLTAAQPGMSGTFLIPDPLAGQNLGSFFASFRLNLTPPEGVTPADGVGFHVDNGLFNTNAGLSEGPRATGLSVCFDVYNNVNESERPVTNENEAPAIKVYWNGGLIAKRSLPAVALNTQGQFADVRIKLDEDGTIDVAFAGVLAVNNVDIPGYAFPLGADFGIGGRTGGAWQAQGVDNLAIKATVFSGPIDVVDQPDSQTILAGYPLTFSVATNDPDRTSYQWQRREPGQATFANINGATSQEYTTPNLAVADNQAAYRCRVTSTNSTTRDSEPAIATVLNVPIPAAPQVRYTFDGGTVANTGSAAGVIANPHVDIGPAPRTAWTIDQMVTATGGTNDSGVLHVTDAQNDVNGIFVIQDYSAGAGIGAMTAAFDLRLGGGSASPADGWSFSWGTGIANAQANGELEKGVGNDLRVVFDVYDNTDGNPNNPPGEAPRVDVVWRGTVIGTTFVPFNLLNTGDAFEKVVVQVTNEGKVTVAQDGHPILVDVQIPGYTGLSAGNFALAGRTGGANTNQWFDNVVIGTSAFVGPISFAQNLPALTTVLEGKAVTLTVQVNDPTRTTFKWQRQLPGEAAFSDVAGATTASYTTPVLTTAQALSKYRCVCTATTNTLTSTEATINVVSLGLPGAWESQITFNDGAVPAGGTFYFASDVNYPPTPGDEPGIVKPTGGVNNSGHAQLTPGLQGQSGVFLLEDQDGGAAVTSMTTQFYLRIGNGSGNPADGMSFSWGPNIADATFGEDGSGSGLVVSFDTYDNTDGNPRNGVGEAPSIELKWGGISLGNLMVPLDLLYTNTAFVPVLVRVNADGTADVVFNDTVAFWHVPLPNWTGGLENARFAWAGRTGGEFALQAVDEISINTTTSNSGGDASIAINVSGGNVIITFQGVLQTAQTTSPGISGWVNVQGATSPYTLPLNGLTGKRFFRAVIP